MIGDNDIGTGFVKGRLLDLPDEYIAKQGCGVGDDPFEGEGVGEPFLPGQEKREEGISKQEKNREHQDDPDPP